MQFQPRMLLSFRSQWKEPVTERSNVSFFSILLTFASKMIINLKIGDCRDLFPIHAPSNVDNSGGTKRSG